MNTIDLNSKIGRESYFSSNESVRKEKYTDASIVSIPPYLERIAKAPYDKAQNSRSIPDILGDSMNHSSGIKFFFDLEFVEINSDDDLQSSSLAIEALASSYNKMVRDLESEYNRSLIPADIRGLDDLSHLDEITNALWQGHRLANLKELSKRQVLVESPTWHHGCSDGDHFNIKENLDDALHDKLEQIGNDMGEYFAKKRGFIKRSDSFTLPLGSSQGVILKSRRDSPQFRAMSKALQGRYAQLCENEKQLIDLLDALNDLSESKGYDRFFDSFFLGKRKQHANKQELIDDGDDDMEVTYGIQGRVRGIFPPPEVVKVYYKPFSDGLKKFLFESTFLCSVDPDLIFRKQIKAISMYICNGISSGFDNCSHGFYDLSAYDRNTSFSLGNAYQSFCRAVFENWNDKEGCNFTNFKLLFPEHCGPDAGMVLQDIKYRSTLSGQPDVTVKNNICHMILLTEAIEAIANKRNLQVSRQQVWDFFLDGTGIREFPGLVAAIHGDDAFVSWIGMTKEDMEQLHETFSKYGIPCADEESLIYLKRTFDLKVVIKELKSVDKSLFSDKSIKGISKLSDLITKRLLSNKASIANVTGSIVRNRFGEYPILEPVVGIISYVDTMSKLDCFGMIKCCDYWKQMLNYYAQINRSFSEYDGEQEKKLNDGRSFRKRWIDSRNKETEANQTDKERRGDEVEYNNSTSKQAREGVNGVISQYIDKWEYSIKTDFDVVGEKIRNESFRNDISGYLNRLMSDKSEVAIALRSFLSRLYYSSFEQFEDDDLAAIYGDLFYSSDDLANDGFLAGKSRLEIFDIILNLEEMLLDGNGEITIPSEIASVGEILLKKMN